MTMFEDIATLNDYSVVHSQRKEGVTLIATRVPLDDIRLENWGWVLSLSQKDARNDQDDIETLQDNAGRRYPRVYTLPDVQSYAEKWACTQWKMGYSNNDYMSDLEVNVIENDKTQEDVLLIGSLHDTVTALSSQIKIQHAEIYEKIEGQRVAFHTELKDQFVDLTEGMKKQIEVLDDEVETLLLQTQETIIKPVEEAKKQIELLNEDVENQAMLIQKYTFDVVDTKSFEIREAAKKYLDDLIKEVQGQSLLVQRNTLEVVEAQSLAVRDETKRLIDIDGTETKNQLSLIQKNTIDAIEGQFLITQQSIQKNHESVYEEIKTRLEVFSIQMRDLQEQTKKVLEVIEPDEDVDAEKTENEDVVSTAANIARRATTQIERIAANQQRLSTSYYNNANKQAQEGFRLARTLTDVGAAFFFVVIAFAVLMTFLHLYGYTVLLGAVGTIGGAIVTAVGGLNSLQASTAKQFARSHLLLDRSYRATIAHAMCNGYADETRKEQAIDKVIDGLLKSDDLTISQVKS